MLKLIKKVTNYSKLMGMVSMNKQFFIFGQLERPEER
jgi:hypothetical protein